jgi:hypothetical protein
MQFDIHTYVQTKLYDGIDRRQSARTKVKVVARLIVNEREAWVPVANISHGGCKAIIPFLINPQGVIAMQFLKREDNTFKEMTPIHGRVIGIHKKQNSYHTNIDFKGALFEEHGIADLITEWQSKVK